MSGLRTCSSCSTSPSAIRLVVSARICITSMRSSSTISWKLREYRKSPTSTLAALPQTALAVLRPRRRSDSSTTSSCSRVAVWMNSTTAASWCASGPRWPSAPADSNSSIGRSRLPPAPMMYSATWLISTTSDASRRRIRASTAAMSALARLWIAGRSRDCGWEAVSMRGPIRGDGDYTEPSRAFFPIGRRGSGRWLRGRGYN